MHLSAHAGKLTLLSANSISGLSSRARFVRVHRLHSLSQLLRLRLLNSDHLHLRRKAFHRLLQRTFLLKLHLVVITLAAFNSRLLVE